MSVQNKPDYKIFADGAKPGEVVAFPDVSRGWGVTLDTTGGIPPMEFANAVAKRLNEWLMYLAQRGISEWESSITYPANAITNENGVLYISSKENKGSKPSTSQSIWINFKDYLDINNRVRKDAVKQTTGTSQTDIMSQKAVTDAISSSVADYLKLTGGELSGPLSIATDGAALVIKSVTAGGPCYMQGRDNDNRAVWFIGKPTAGGNVVYFRNYLTGNEISLHESGVNIKGRLTLSDYSAFDAKYSKIRKVVKGDSGYEKDEDTGMIRQWGKTQPFGAGNGFPVKFPIPFPSKCAGVSALPIRDSATSAGSAETIYCGTPGLSGVQLYLGGTINYPVYWEAWGY